MPQSSFKVEPITVSLNGGNIRGQTIVNDKIYSIPVEETNLRSISSKGIKPKAGMAYNIAFASVRPKH